MIKFNEKEKRDNVNGALALRSDINRIVDSLWEKKIKNISTSGCGTYERNVRTQLFCRKCGRI